MTEYIYAAVVVCPVEMASVGNALAASIDPSGGGDLTFTDEKAIKCYPPGTTFQGDGLVIAASSQPSAYAATPALTQVGHDAVVSAVSSGQYDAIKVLIGPRGTVEDQWRSYIESLGYTLP